MRMMIHHRHYFIFSLYSEKRNTASSIVIIIVDKFQIRFKNNTFNFRYRIPSPSPKNSIKQSGKEIIQEAFRSQG